MDGRVQAWSPLCRVRHPARTRPRATDEFPPVSWSNEDRTQHPTGRCPKEEWMPKITPCLWFDTEGEQAAQHYSQCFLTRGSPTWPATVPPDPGQRGRS